MRAMSGTEEILGRAFPAPKIAIASGSPEAMDRKQPARARPGAQGNSIHNRAPVCTDSSASLVQTGRRQWGTAIRRTRQARFHFTEQALEIAPAVACVVQAVRLDGS